MGLGGRGRYSEMDGWMNRKGVAWSGDGDVR